MDRFVGKFMGSVVANDDPKHIGRIRATVPEVLHDEPTGWCLPCTPYAGPGVGLAVVPPVGASVFVEWPAGDVTRVPIWSGAVWADGDGVKGAGPDVILLVTPAGHRVEIRDSSDKGGVLIESASGASVSLHDQGVTVSFGGQKLQMSGSSISFNDGALTVS